MLCVGYSHESGQSDNVAVSVKNNLQVNLPEIKRRNSSTYCIMYSGSGRECSKNVNLPEIKRRNSSIYCNLCSLV